MTTASEILTKLKGDPKDRVVVVGAGIVGSAIATYLSLSTPFQIVIIDPSFSELQGSTGHAPGFVGQFNVSSTLTKLATASVAEYLKIPNGFDRVGGLEIASTPAGIKELQDRYELALKAGLPSKLITSAEAAQLAPQFHKADDVSKALHHLTDGTANAKEITSDYQLQAKSLEAVFLEAKALSIEHDNGILTGITTSVGPLKTSRLVIATGIWTSSLLSNAGISLPIIPVAHPYVYGPRRKFRAASPYVRWPERHVYARDHGFCDGFGSYDHPVIPVDSLTSSASIDWDVLFDEVIERAMENFPGLMERKDVKTVNGIYALTPDGLPLAGPIKQVKGLWVASAVWITHAAGVGKLIADMLAEREVDPSICQDLDPDRFAGLDEAELRRKALSTYSIYRKEEV